jgi:hypothetical protein
VPMSCFHLIDDKRLLAAEICEVQNLQSEIDDDVRIILEN